MKTIRFSLALSLFVLGPILGSPAQADGGTSWIPFMKKDSKPAKSTTIRKRATPSTKSTGTGLLHAPSAVSKFFTGGKTTVTTKKKPTAAKLKGKSADEKPSGLKALFVRDTSPPPPPQSIKEWMALKQIKP